MRTLSPEIDCDSHLFPFVPESRNHNFSLVPVQHEQEGARHVQRKGEERKTHSLHEQTDLLCHPVQCSAEPVLEILTRVRDADTRNDRLELALTSEKGQDEQHHICLRCAKSSRSSTARTPCGTADSRVVGIPLRARLEVPTPGIPPLLWPEITRTRPAAVLLRSPRARTSLSRASVDHLGTPIVLCVSSLLRHEPMMMMTMLDCSYHLLENLLW